MYVEVGVGVGVVVGVSRTVGITVGVGVGVGVAAVAVGVGVGVGVGTHALGVDSARCGFDVKDGLFLGLPLDATGRGETGSLNPRLVVRRECVGRFRVVWVVTS